ncbi:hypothetical protein AZE42_07625 [Rhizopogon vesiculosus]|uniref:Uncharacterized protein n=1 Tax=Rhizopogon vesiculosus TaxID=180088 RepID=A0A1J8QLK2_9AGAM|nr:hypothetical protein AZE42_07625 [Rhizopogon vesiculosus]
MFVGRHKAQPSPSHKSNWEIARGFLRPVGYYYNKDPKPTMTDDEVFQTWLTAPHKLLILILLVCWNSPKESWIC